jgi:hypothetical protein
MITGLLVCVTCAGLAPAGQAVHPGTVRHPVTAGAVSTMAGLVHDEVPRGGPLSPWRSETFVTGSTTPTSGWGGPGMAISGWGGPQPS